MTLIKRAILAFALIAGFSPVFAQAPAPVPALPDTERRTSYSISATTCACAVNFQIYGDSTDYQNWIEVSLNGIKVEYNDPLLGWKITSPSGSVASLARPITDGVLTFNAAQTGTVQIVGAQRPRRLTEVAENRGVAARDFNQFANTVSAELREVWDRFLRTPRVPAGETTPILPPLASRANMGVCFDNLGHFAPCVLPSGSFTAGSGVTFTGTNPTTISVPTYVAGSGITFTGTNPTTISANSSATFIATRAAAIALDLSAYSVVKTGGYTTAGDGGGATFKKIGAGTPFIDQTVDTIGTAPLPTGGSGYTNGTYNAVPFGGGTGGNCAGQAIVSGGAVVQVQILMPCPGFTVGDVLTTPNTSLGGTGSGFSLLVRAVNPAKGSFVDAAGNKFQIVTDEGIFPNVLQFGAVPDANGDGVTGTNSRPAFISALGFAYYPNFTGAANVNATIVMIPKGAFLLCGGGISGATIPIPQGIKLHGAGKYGGTSLFQCAAESGANHFFILCDIYTVRGQLGCAAEEFFANTVNATTNSNIAVFYSVSGQQFELLHNVTIAAGLKSCLFYDYGLGGAANAIFNGVECQQNVAATNAGVNIGPNIGGTLITFRDWVVECSGGPCASNYAVVVQGTPYAVFNQFHIEGHQLGFLVTGSAGSFFLRDLSEAGPCNIAVTLANATAFIAATMENLNSSCTTTVQNNHTGGSSVSGVMYPQRTFNP